MIRILRLLLIIALLPQVATAHQFEVDNIYYNFIDENSVEVTFYSESHTMGDYKEVQLYSGKVVIPPTVTYEGRTYKVTAIGYRAFEKCLITSVSIPSTVTSIGGNAFYQCYKLKKIVIPSSVTSIEPAFSWCEALTSIKIEKGNPVYDSRDNCNAIVETARNTLIAGCSKTKIPNTVTRIGNSAFSYCHKLSSITIPNSVTEIGDNAFAYCEDLRTVNMSNSATIIGAGAFSNCINLKKLSLPPTLKTIKAAAFSYCYDIESVTIPNTVTTIGKQAFYPSGLKYIECLAEDPDSMEVAKDAFQWQVKANSKLIVPANSVEKYKSSDQWKDFKNIVAK
ncbi:MAG: leucine-rich repeat domain-containing protein [Muribaculaceae bacterium]|nr:leucine-rich repeat domain-containing protein [Muribaculaceae bacterium]